MAEPASKSNFQRWATGFVGFVVPALAIGLPVLYVIGRVYKEAYWSALGVPYTLMGYSVEEYVYWGFVALVNGLVGLASHLPLGPFGTWLAAMTLVMVLLLLTFFLRDAIRRFLIWLVSAIEAKAGKLRASDKDWHKQFALPLLTLGQWINSAYFGFLLLVLILSLPILWATSAGKQQADKTRAWLLDNHGRNLHSQPNNQEQKGIEGNTVIECTAAWCVVAEEGRVMVIASSDMGAIKGSLFNAIRKPAERASRSAE